uniref:Ribonuclease H-like domain-containing protein n=1 Tax=Tanacetum cinerariifolium TaxID=118510 RepID=A0A699GJ93_TANCI|nr:ribonuclease H-like domain-containing protein [Tanacetum cinerariifolium]
MRKFTGDVLPLEEILNEGRLLAKAIADESKLWHRRLGHLNFKTINKLVNGNLVRDNIPSIEIEINSMLDVKVHHEDLSNQTSPVLTVPVSVITDTSVALATNVPSHTPQFIPLPQQSTLIPTLTTTKATTSTTAIPDSTTLTAILQRLFDLEKEVKILKSINYSLIIVLAIKSKVPTVVQEYLRNNLEDILCRPTQKSAEDIQMIKKEHREKQQQPKYTIVSSDADSLNGFDHKRTVFETMTKTKSFDQNSKHKKALYHVFIVSILEDEDSIDKGVADKQKKRKPDDKDWNNPEGDRYTFDLSKPLPLVESRNRLIVLPDYFFNNDLAYLQGGSTNITYTTSLTNTKAAKYDLNGIEDMFMEGDFLKLQLNDIEDMLLLIVQNKLFNLKSDVIVNLVAALHMFTRRIVIQKRVEDLQLGFESYQKKLNISKTRTRDEDLSQREPYTTLSDL